MAHSYFLISDRDSVRYLSALGFSSILDVARMLDNAANAPGYDPGLDNIPAFLRTSGTEFTELGEGEFRERTGDCQAPPVGGLLVSLNLRDGFVRVCNQTRDREVCSVAGDIYQITGLYELARKGQPDGELDTDRFLSGLLRHCLIEFYTMPERGLEVPPPAPAMTMA